MSIMQSLIPFILVGLRLGVPVFAQDQQVQFNQVITLNGDMQLNTLNFPDGSRIETFSQKQQQILVSQNTPSIAASHVTGSTGQPFVQISPNSMTIQSNNATDLVGGQIVMTLNSQMLTQLNISPDNTFVAQLAPDKQSWIVLEGIKSVNTTDSTVRMVKLNSIDGEYLAIGRQTAETSVVLTPFGMDASQSVQVSGSGIQELEFQDGFRMSIQASQPITINSNVVNGVSNSMLVGGSTPVNNFRYKVVTNLAAVQPDLNQMMAVVQLPLNAERVMALAQQMGAGPSDTVQLSIEQRGVLLNPGGATGNLNPRQENRQTSTRTTASTSTSSDDASSSTDAANASTSSAGTPTTTDQPQTGGEASQGGNNGGNGNGNGNAVASNLLLAPTFTPITAPTVLDRQNARIATTVGQLDGEFIITMKLGGQGQQTPGQGQQIPGQGQPNPGQEQQTPGQGQQIPGQTPEPTRQQERPINSTSPQVPPEATPIPGASPIPGSSPIPEAAPVSSAAPLPFKRQIAAPIAGLTMTMAELALMANEQKYGGIQATKMMSDYLRSQGGAPAPAAPLRLIQRRPRSRRSSL